MKDTGKVKIGWCVMRAVSLRKLLPVFATTALVLALASSASANSFTLQNTNLAGVTNVGTVTVTDTGTDQVTVTITMNAGFSIKLNGGDVAFNGPGSGTGDLSGLRGEGGFEGGFGKGSDGWLDYWFE